MAEDDWDLQPYPVKVFQRLVPGMSKRKINAIFSQHDVRTLMISLAVFTGLSSTAELPFHKYQLPAPRPTAPMSHGKTFPLGASAPAEAENERMAGFEDRTRPPIDLRIGCIRQRSPPWEKVQFKGKIVLQ